MSGRTNRRRSQGYGRTIMNKQIKRINYYTYCKVPKNKLPGINTPVTGDTIQNAIGDLFHQQFGDRIISIDYRSDELVFNFPLRNAKEGSVSGIKEVTSKILQLLNDFYKDIISKPLKLQHDFLSLINTIPTFKVECDRVALNYNSLGDKKNTLEEIHKILSAKEITIYISPSNHITGNVLGLLKIDKLEKLTYILEPVPQWFKIVKKHFENGKDIIACQEELIDAGLKDHAEL